MRFFFGILLACGLLCFFEQAAYRFSGKYAGQKGDVLTTWRLNGHWLYENLGWLPVDAWANPAAISSDAEPISLVEPENQYARRNLRHLRPLRDELYDVFLKGATNVDSLVDGKLAIPRGMLFVPSQPDAERNDQVILILTGPGGNSMGGGPESLSLELAAILGQGVSCAVAKVSNFAEVLETAGALAGPHWKPERTVAACAYGEQAGFLALARANRPELLTAAAALSPVGNVFASRWQKAEYPSILFAARVTDSKAIRANALLWATQCRKASQGNFSSVFGAIAPAASEETFSDLKLKTLGYAFLLDSLRQRKVRGGG